MFYLNCFLKNPKDVWNKFTSIDTNSFDTTKSDSLLCQKSKDFFMLEKRKHCEPKCFGLIFTEDISIRNWINRKPEDVGIVYPKTFKNLEDFAEGHNLECFICLVNEAINYETKALHIRADMFFERTDVKQNGKEF